MRFEGYGDNPAGDVRHQTSDRKKGFEERELRFDEERRQTVRFQTSDRRYG